MAQPSTNIFITADTCRAARALATISQKDLAESANIAKQTVVDFERGARNPYPNNLTAIQSTLEAQGVIFIPADDTAGAGVRLKK